MNFNPLKLFRQNAESLITSDGSGKTGGIPESLPQFISEQESSISQTCIGWISDTLMTSPLKVYTPSGIELTLGTLPDLLRQPSVKQGWSDFLQQYVSKQVFDGKSVLVFVNDELRLAKASYARRGAPTTMVSLDDNRSVPVPTALVREVPYRVDKNGKAYTPLNSTKIELMSDFIRSWRTGTLLENEALPSAIISPKSGGKAMTPKGLDNLVDKYQAIATTNRGKATGFNQSMDVVFPPGTNLRYLDMRSIAWIAEERVCAVLRVSPDVVKLGVGLEQTRVGATMHEAVLDSWRGSVRPAQKKIEDALTGWLVPLVGMPEGTLIQFDNSVLSVLGEEEERIKQYKSTRLLAELQAEIIDKDEYRREMYND